MTKPEKITLERILEPNAAAQLQSVAKRIAEGAVCIYPTETIYGIGGRFDSQAVFKKIIAAKGRSPEQPMILIGSSLECFSMFDIELPKAAQKCAEHFWPGLLTMVVPSPLQKGGVGIRVSNHPFITALSPYLSVPIFSTSANVTGVPYNPDPEVIFKELGGKVDFMIDAGELPPSLPSTVIRITEDNSVTILREGCIAASSIHALLAAMYY